MSDIYKVVETPLVDALAKTYPVESDYRQMVKLAKHLETKTILLKNLLEKRDKNFSRVLDKLI